MNKREIGARFEGLAVAYLERGGYSVLAKNFRCAQGEIDIVAARDGTLVFFEVKYRTSRRSGNPEEAVDRKKQRIISRVAMYYLARFKVKENTPCRFDVLALTEGGIRHYENAFDFVP